MNACPIMKMTVWLPTCSSFIEGVEIMVFLCEMHFFAELIGREPERQAQNRHRVANHENDVMLPKCSSSSKALESWNFYAECLYPRDEF